ncbi:MAG: hypothetical protein SFT81_01805 [Candidatus Caenarcaniphilales bacterium]|nr:hypothetical protein [Candidatus Caenarcaniphilales bacterium]
MSRSAYKNTETGQASFNTQIHRPNGLDSHRSGEAYSGVGASYSGQTVDSHTGSTVAASGAFANSYGQFGAGIAGPNGAAGIIGGPNGVIGGAVYG